MVLKAYAFIFWNVLQSMEIIGVMLIETFFMSFILPSLLYSATMSFTFILI